MRVKQILLNLIGNAVKFTAKGNITISVNHLEQYDGTMLVRITVRDTGIGISPAVLDEIIKREGELDANAEIYVKPILPFVLLKRIRELIPSVKTQQLC
ncbi:MAG: ATP-binding protein [Desulfuromonadales bacterium]